MVIAFAAAPAMSAEAVVYSFTGGGDGDAPYASLGGGLYAAVHHGGVACATTDVQYDAGVKDQKGKVPAGGTVQFADTTLAKAGAGYIGLDVDLG
jgi:hypothetical protein